jgi:hypothetical protein
MPRTKHDAAAVETGEAENAKTERRILQHFHQDENDATTVTGCMEGHKEEMPGQRQCDICSKPLPKCAVYAQKRVYENPETKEVVVLFKKMHVNCYINHNLKKEYQKKIDKIVVPLREKIARLRKGEAVPDSDGE